MAIMTRILHLTLSAAVGLAMAGRPVIAADFDSDKATKTPIR